MESSAPPGRIVSQLFLQQPVFASGHSIEQGMEGGAVISVQRMAQLVDQDIVDQPVGQFHQMEAQREVVSRRAAAPARAAVADGHFSAAESQFAAQLGHCLLYTSPSPRD